jgi:hypothetical protein
LAFVEVLLLLLFVLVVVELELDVVLVTVMEDDDDSDLWLVNAEKELLDFSVMLLEVSTGSVTESATVVTDDSSGVVVLAVTAEKRSKVGVIEAAGSEVVNDIRVE